MTQNKREYRPEILLEEIDFKKPTEEVSTPLPPALDKKSRFFKDLKKDITFISVVSIALFSVLGNISVYMLKTNPPSVTYIPKQINLSETDVISRTANEAAKNLMNFNATNINSYSNNSNNNTSINKTPVATTSQDSIQDYFYKDNFEQWKSTLKQIGLFDKVVNNNGSVSSELGDVHLMSKVIVHGMVRNIISIPFTQTYVDKKEKTMTQGRLILTMIENPDQENQFLIYNTQVFLGDSNSTILK